MTPHKANSVVVVGGGIAGLRTLEGLRSGGYEGRLVLVGEEEHSPYNRPPLSKSVLTGEKSATETVFRDTAQMCDLDVEFDAGQRALRMDLAEQKVLCVDTEYPFDVAVVATGARSRRLGELEGLRGVHYLRTMEDAVALRSHLEQRPRVVVVGAGFIGAEVASAARALGLETTVLETLAVPAARAVGASMGAVLARLHHINGARLRCGVTVTGLAGHGRVERVLLSDGTSIDADLVVIGAGAVPNTEWLADSGLTLDDGVACDQSLRTSHPAVYAVGDCARWHNALFGRTMRAEQWTNAILQARHVARSIVDDIAAGPFTSSNYFWSDQYGVRIHQAGEPVAEEVVFVDGTADQSQFTALYRRDERLSGVLSMNSPKLFFRAKALLEKRCDWTDALRQCSASTEPRLTV